MLESEGNGPVENLPQSLEKNEICNENRNDERPS